MRLSQVIAAACAAFVIQVFPAAADDTALVKEIVAAKTALDQAFQDRDVDTIEAMVTSTHVGVTSYYAAPLTMNQQLSSISEFDATYLDFSEPKVKVFTPDSAMVTFENSFKGTFQGRPLPERVFVSEIWLKQDGKWLQDLYQETPIAAE